MLVQDDLGFCQKKVGRVNPGAGIYGPPPQKGVGLKLYGIRAPSCIEYFFSEEKEVKTFNKTLDLHKISITIFCFKKSWVGLTLGQGFMTPPPLNIVGLILC